MGRYGQSTFDCPIQFLYSGASAVVMKNRTRKHPVSDYDKKFVNGVINGLVKKWKPT